LKSNKIFLFADLDETFIQREDRTDFSKEPIVAEYSSDGRALSYIYRERKEFIDRLLSSGYIEFIPTTSRNLQSYSQTIFSQHYNFQHVILNSSGVILENRHIDLNWQNSIRNYFFKLPLKISQLLQQIEREFYENFHNKYIPLFRNIDDQYILVQNSDFATSDKVTKEIGKFISDFIFKNGLHKSFYIHKEGAEFHIFPEFLNKSLGVKYLIDKYKPSLVIGAGDNISDIDFMNLAQFTLSPVNSTLNRITTEYVQKLTNHSQQK
jgi:hypothetical protein